MKPPRTKAPSGMPPRIRVERPGTKPESLSRTIKEANDAAMLMKEHRITRAVVPLAYTEPVKPAPSTRNSNWSTPAQRRQKALGALVSPKRR